VDFGGGAVINFDSVQTRFFDKYLKGVDNGQERDPHARIFVMGANEWRDEHEWPIARAQPTKWYLHSNGRANSLTGDGTLSAAPPNAERPDHYDYDPADPPPMLGVDSYAQVGTAEDYRPLEHRDDVLVYTSPAMDAEI